MSVPGASRSLHVVLHLLVHVRVAEDSFKTKLPRAEAGLGASALESVDEAQTAQRAVRWHVATHSPLDLQ